MSEEYLKNWNFSQVYERQSKGLKCFKNVEREKETSEIYIL